MIRCSHRKALVYPWLPVAVALVSSRAYRGGVKKDIIAVRTIVMNTSSTMCPCCCGEGLVLKKKGHKATSLSRSLETQLSILSNRMRPHHAIRPCELCHGTGVRANQFLNNDATGTTSDLNDGDASSSLHVSIVGGGIGGCALALALCQRNISCTLYERDRSSNVRSQGYGLTIQQGFKALQSLGLIPPQEQQYHIGIKGAGHFVYQSDGTVQSRWGAHSSRHTASRGCCNTINNGNDTLTERNPKRFNVIIPRRDLRQLILDQIPPHVIKWGHELVNYCEKDQKIEVKFLISSHTGNEVEDNSIDEMMTATTDILVGADGIWSRVRKCMYGQNETAEDPSPLRYLQCMVILGIAPTPTSHPHHPLKLDDPNHPIIFETMDGETRIYGMPHRRGEIMWQLSFPVPCEASAKKLSALGAEAMKEEAIKRCHGWHEPISSLLMSTPIQSITGYPLYDRPIPDPITDSFRRNRQTSHVTLIGDSAHPMAAFKAQGANQALIDAVTLARVLHRSKHILASPARGIISNNDDQTLAIDSIIPRALTWFENEMMERVKPKVVASADASQYLHTKLAIAQDNITRSDTFKRLSRDKH